MNLTQIAKIDGEIRRVPRGTEPVIETRIAEGAYVTSVEIHEAPWMFYAHDRATVDYLWTAYVVHPL